MFRRPLLCLICMFMCVNIADAAPFAYITNAGTGSGVDTVSIIDTSNNSIVKTVPIIHPTNSTYPTHPYGVAVSGAGDRVYVSNQLSKTISVIDSSTSDNTVIATITRLNVPGALAVNPAGSRLYVANEDNGTVSVINTADYSVIGSAIGVGNGPKGIVLNADGTKAYVTNSGSDSVSVIAANDGTNTYVKEGSDIAVGSSPVGIAYHPSGKLFVSNFGGNSVSAVVLAPTPAVTPIPLGSNANPSGITVSGDIVYVSMSGLDKVGIINATTDAVIATPVISTGQAPWGLAINPANSLLYVANSIDSAEFGTVTAYDTTSGSLTATAQVGKSPQAFGNFIGPMMYPVSQTVSGCGSITPAGGADGKFFLKSGNSQSFAITPTSECVTRGITVDGESQLPSNTSWDFPTIAAPHTLTATFGYPIVSVGMSGLGTGTVTSTAPNAFVNCPGYCSADYAKGTSITLHATAVSPNTFTGWSGGGCSGTGDCTFVLNADTTVTATFDVVLGGDVKVGSNYYASIAAAYAGTGSGPSEFRVKKTYATKEVLVFADAAKNFAITLSGGWNDDQTAQVLTTERTTIGGLTIQYGTVTVDRIDIQ